MNRTDPFTLWEKLVVVPLMLLFLLIYYTGWAIAPALLVFFTDLPTVNAAVVGLLGYVLVGGVCVILVMSTEG